MKRAGCLIAVTALLAIPSSGKAASTSPPPPEDLMVEGGEEAWRATNRFRLDWKLPPPSPGFPSIAAIHLQVRDDEGAIVVPERRIAPPVEMVNGIAVPGGPGIYTAEVWFEDSEAKRGPSSFARLRFDDARPERIDPLHIPDWLGRTAFPFAVQLGYQGKRPLSGIGGYAVALDFAPEADPCAEPDRCTAAETDVLSGVGGNAFAINALPEGTTYIHALAVSGSGMKSIGPAHGVLRVDLTDPVTHLAGTPGGWTNRPVALTATATDAGSGMGASGLGSTSFTALRVDGGAPRTSPGASVSTAVITEGVHSVEFYARDMAGNVNDGGISGGVRNREPSTATVRIDRTPPSVTFASSQDSLDPELIRVQVTDAPSGPDLRRGTIGIRSAGSGDRFEELRTGAAPGGFQARWDSESYPPGQYELRAVGYDAAGNVASTMERANGARMVLPNPLKTASVLQAGLAGGAQVSRRRKAKRVVPLGLATPFSGRLSSAAGSPLGGMQVRVVERFAGGANPVERVSTVETRGDGTFALLLPAGPSREVTAAFSGTPSLTRSASSPIRLCVRSAVGLRVSSTVAKVGGRPLVFHGKLATAGAEVPAEGKSVQLQFRLPGLPWAEFRTVQTDGKGRFSLAYRFSDDDSRGVRFQFRAYAPAQDDWPYEPGGSRPIAVWGR